MSTNHPEEGLRKLVYSTDMAPDVGARMRLLEDPVSKLVKSASNIFKCSCDDLRPDKNHVGIHTVALGQWETYGGNRNGDTFPKKACETRHDTFVKHGHVFVGHDNRDPAKAVGKIVKSAYNEPMGRIELFIHAHKDKAQPQLHKLATSGDHPFSMACLRAGTPVVTTCGTKVIENIQPGDTVLTHAGNWGIVGNRSTRMVDEYLRVRMVSWGRTDLEITGNHEVYVARFEDIPSTRPMSSTGRRLSQARRAYRPRLHEYARWIPAAALTDLHYMLVPIDRTETETVDTKWARVLGYYIAEGSLTQGCTQFTCHRDDAAPAELSGLAPWTSTTIIPKTNCDVAVTVNCFGTDLHDRIDALCGHPGPNKRIPILIQHADVEAKLNFMAAWFNGDGWQDKNGLHWSTHYQNLAIDLQRLLASVDIPSSCMRIDHPEDRGIISAPNAIEYVVSISNEFSDSFADISKAGVMDIYGCTKCRTFISGDYLCVPVHSVTVIKGTVPVYNFSVVGDESYTVYGLAVHNCKVPYDRCTICNTLRKSAADNRQCDHVRDHLGETWSDGKFVGTHNDLPTWFDESFVDRPADRIAWHLKIASNGPIASWKLAEAAGIWVPDTLEDDVPGYSHKHAILKKLAEFEQKYIQLNGAVKSGHDRYMWELRKAAAYALPDVTVQELRGYEPSEVFMKLAVDGVVMDAPTFFKYALGIDYGALKDDMPAILADIRSGIFTKLYKAGAYQRVCRNTYFDVDSYRLKDYGWGQNLELSRFAADKVAAVGSFTGHGVDTRIIDATLCGRQPETIVVKSGSAIDNSGLHRGAEIYAAYKLSAVNAILGCHKENEDRLLALAAVQNLVR